MSQETFDLMWFHGNKFTFDGTTKHGQGGKDPGNEIAFVRASEPAGLPASGEAPASSSGEAPAGSSGGAPASKRKRKSQKEEEAWKAPTEPDIAFVTKQYKQKKVDGDLPKSDNVVLGYWNKTGKKFFAYCTVCRMWFNWPPSSNLTEDLTPCPCEQ